MSTASGGSRRMLGGVHPTMTKRALGLEVLIVLGISLGASALYSVVSLTAKLTAGPLKDATATLNKSVTPRPYLDLTYQILGITTTLVPVVLVLFLMSFSAPGVRRRIGFDFSHFGKDLFHGALLALAIGLPGLVLYVVGREIGITAKVVPEALAEHWWTVPVLILQALKNSLLEEVIVVAYLADRFSRLGWSPLRALAGSALLRGTYHAYQGFGALFGNIVMGVVFWEYYRRFGRVMPLVIAHFYLDIVAFVGYSLFGHYFAFLQ